jgi:type VI secretion system (T6SS) effector TldE1-like protein
VSVTFVIRSGAILIDGVQVGSGYAGNGSAINDPFACNEPGVGPLPPGEYAIQEPIDSPHTGPFSLPLVPDPVKNQMFGRGDFLIHGGLANEPCDSPSVTPGGSRTASHGCIVTCREVRAAIDNDPDRILAVRAA